jgi:hypothetical protein
MSLESLAMKQGSVEVPIEKRTCNKECNCLKNYKNSSTEPEKIFTL